MPSSKKGFKRHLEVVILQLFLFCFFIEKAEKPTLNACLHFFHEI